MATKRKTTTAIVAGVTAAALLLGGTFAWTSISQQARNEAIVDINPGGRLHDDFNGTNKDVYVENFGDELTGVPIFARIRLYEYMEIGQQAGDKTITEGKKANSLIDGDAITDTANWEIYKYDTESAFTKYWEWTLGNNDGATLPYYMPTFNKNKDSLAADINGTYEGTVDGDIVHYDDYKQYGADSTETDTEVYDHDSNTTEEAEDCACGTTYSTTDSNAPIDDAHVRLNENAKHTAQQISTTSTVMSMAEWIAAGSQPGNYWVFDTDGWAYWANPIQPGKTTGLLLDGISMIRVPDDNWYYGINVVGQFATAGDWEMFFAPEADGGAGEGQMTEDAKTLLNIITSNDKIEISGADTIKVGETATYTATRTVDGNAVATQPTFTWSVNEIEGVTMADGTLTVDDTVSAGTEITITATVGDGTATAVEGETNVLSGTKKVIVEGTIDIAAVGNTTRYTPGTELTETFTATLKGATETDGTVTWAVADNEGNELTETTIANGSLTIGANETAPKIIVTATYKSNDGEVEFSGTYEILNDNEIETTDDPEVQAAVYAIKTVNGTDDSGADTYKLSFVRSVEEITTANLYNSKPILDVQNVDTAASRDRFWMGDTTITDASFDNEITLGANSENGRDMGSFFSQMSNLKTVDVSKLDTSNVTYFANMFYKCENLKTIEGISGWNVGNVTDMRTMFQYCENLEEIDLSGWGEQLSQVTDMKYMFYYCERLKELELANWNVSSVSDMSCMFSGCKNLELLDLSNWTVGSVDMAQMFRYCDKLKTITGISDWDVSKVTNMSGVFMDCPSLETVGDISGWDVSNVTDMGWMFSKCKQLTVDCSAWDVTNVETYTKFNEEAPGVIPPIWPDTTN